MINRRLITLLAALALGAEGVRAQGCAAEKLGQADFRQQFEQHRYDLIVQLDVDKEYNELLRESAIPDKRPDDERNVFLHELSQRLTAAKQKRLEGTRFRIYENLELGPAVVIRASTWQDVCELTSNPHVVRIWLNLPVQLT